jgi:hypothetical protein
LIALILQFAPSRTSEARKLIGCSSLRRVLVFS